mmetsp:Transcript_12135/g.28360  ORF Transcript_12135/g.28360 Transcript_12135/m.28360 type:complete len:239 (-) Transcript_12135:59-775(-)
MAVTLDLLKDAIGLAVEACRRLHAEEVEVLSTVKLHKRPLEMLDVVDNVRVVPGRRRHPVKPRPGRPDATSDTLHVLVGEPISVKMAPVVVWVASLEEANVGIRNDEVVGSAVGVQLLVPLLDEVILNPRPMTLLESVPTHNIQNLKAHSVAVASAAGNCCSHQADPHAGRRIAPVDRGKVVGDSSLGVRQILALVVAVFGDRNKFHLIEAEQCVDPSQPRVALRYSLDVLVHEAHTL